MLIPIGTDRRLAHTPWMNTLLILANIAAAAVVWTSPGWEEGRSEFNRFMLHVDSPRLVQFFSYQFMHAGWQHLIFNLLFLYVFGNAVEDRLGPIGYLAFYLAGGILAAAGHMLVTEGGPMLGASGSIAAVAGAFLALFPLTRVSILFFFFFITWFQISAMWLLGFYFFQDVFFQLFGWVSQRGDSVAYMAHIAGYITGFGVGMALLATRLLPREPYDFLALVDRWNRRRQFRSSARTASPWAGSAPTGRITEQRSDPAQQQTMSMRSAITEALGGGDTERALEIYERLLAHDSGQVLPRQTQIELANRAMANERYGTAARAYELFLQTYRGEDGRAEVQLMLGLIYVRYLGKPDRARTLLQEAREHLAEQRQRDLAARLLEQAGDEP